MLDELRAQQELASAGQAEADKRLAQRMEEEREKRIAHLQRNAARRIMQMGLARGWSGWHDAWSEQRQRKRMLQAAAARLQRPMLTASLAHWRHDWDAERRAGERARGLFRPQIKPSQNVK